MDKKDKHGRKPGDSFYGDNRDDRHIQGQNHIDHLSARARKASELRRRGKLGEGGYTQKDLDNFKGYFGQDIDELDAELDKSFKKGFDKAKKK